MSSQFSALQFRLLGNPEFWPWLHTDFDVLKGAASHDDCREADAIFLPGSDDLSALETLQGLSRLYPRKPIVFLLQAADADQETAAVELGAFDVWTPETRIGPAFARLRNQIAMLKPGISSARKRVHSPFLRRKQRLLQTLLSVVERPDEFRDFVQEFFSGIGRLQSDTRQSEILKRLQDDSQSWGLDFLQKRLALAPSPQNLTLAEQDLRLFIKTHEKLLKPILNLEP